MAKSSNTKRVAEVKRIIGRGGVNVAMFPTWERGYVVAGALLAALERLGDRWALINALRAHAALVAASNGQRADVTEEIIDFVFATRAHVLPELVIEATTAKLNAAWLRYTCMAPVAELACRAHTSAHEFRQCLAFGGVALAESFARTGGDAAVEGLLAFIEALATPARKAG